MFAWRTYSCTSVAQISLLLDEQAKSILDTLDPMAERVRRIGGTTIRSIVHVSQLQTIEDDNRDFVTADEMIEQLLKDNLHMAERQREAIEVCERESGYADR